MSNMKWFAGAATALVMGASAGTAVAGPTLDAIKQRGALVCGVHTGLTGFSAPDKAGKYAGIDVDFCKALAAAILGSPDKVTYVPLTAQQ
ncbi:MAG: amino acid ABC transporter substrate-binding protein, partial [Burkholderiaceae bacterium]